MKIQATSIIALDMDGTLLTTDKRLSERNEAALRQAAEQGALIVPATGRIFRGLPPMVLALPYLKYAITVNGANVYDVDNDATIYRAELPMEEAVEIMRWLDGQPVIYDCYMKDHGWMTAHMWDQIADYAWSPIVVDYMRAIRTPVPELKAFLMEQGSTVQKVQIFCRDDAYQARLLGGLPFPRLAVSSSVPRNVEINHEDANKGAALLALAAHLGVPRERVAAFGDGLNDLSMIRAAGIGVAMGNAIDAVKRQADVVTASNDEDGVAEVIEKLLQ